MPTTYTKLKEQLEFKSTVELGAAEVCISGAHFLPLVERQRGSGGWITQSQRSSNWGKFKVGGGNQQLAPRSQDVSEDTLSSTLQPLRCPAPTELWSWTGQVSQPPDVVHIVGGFGQVPSSLRSVYYSLFTREVSPWPPLVSSPQALSVWTCSDYSPPCEDASTRWELFQAHVQAGRRWLHLSGACFVVLK